MPDPVLVRRQPRRLRLHEGRRAAVDVVWMRELEVMPADDLVRPPAEDPEPRRVRGRERAVGRDDHQQILRVVPRAVAFAGALGDLQLERARELVQPPLGQPPRNGAARALADLADEGDLVVEPDARLRMIRVEQRDEAAVLGQRHVDDRLRADRDQRVGVRRGPRIGPGVREDDGLAALQVLDVRAVVAKVQRSRETRDAGRVPVALDADRLGQRIDRPVADAADAQEAAEHLGGRVRDLGRIDEIPQAIVEFRPRLTQRLFGDGLGRLHRTPGSGRRRTSRRIVDRRDRRDRPRRRRNAARRLACGRRASSSARDAASPNGGRRPADRRRTRSFAGERVAGARDRRRRGAARRGVRPGVSRRRPAVPDRAAGCRRKVGWRRVSRCRQGPEA